MYFRYHLSTNTSNNTLVKLVEALVLSTQLDKDELKHFLLSCFDRIERWDYIGLAIESLKKYLQEVSSDLNEILQQREEFISFIGQNPQFDDTMNSMQIRCNELAGEATRNVEVLQVIEELIALLEVKQKANQRKTLVKSRDAYFELTEDEYNKFEKYKIMHVTFNDFFSVFVVVVRPTRERLESLLKMSEIPTDNSVIKVKFNEQSMLTQFENFSVTSQENLSVSSVTTQEKRADVNNPQVQIPTKIERMTSR